MSSATLARPAGTHPHPRPLPPAAADDRVMVVLRAACLAEVSAETAEWIAADLMRREAGPAGNYAAAAERIRERAVRYRAYAHRNRARAESSRTH